MAGLSCGKLTSGLPLFAASATVVASLSPRTLLSSTRIFIVDCATTIAISLYYSLIGQRSFGSHQSIEVEMDQIESSRKRHGRH